MCTVEEKNNVSSLYKIIKFFSEVSLYSGKRKCRRAAAEVENISGNFLPPKICQNCEG